MRQDYHHLSDHEKKDQQHPRKIRSTCAKKGGSSTHTRQRFTPGTNKPPIRIRNIVLVRNHHVRRKRNGPAIIRPEIFAESAKSFCHDSPGFDIPSNEPLTLVQDVCFDIDTALFPTVKQRIARKVMISISTQAKYCKKVPRSTR